MCQRKTASRLEIQTLLVSSTVTKGLSLSFEEPVLLEVITPPRVPLGGRRLCRAVSSTLSTYGALSRGWSPRPLRCEPTL
jgi:hypothetical protein